MPPVVPVTKTVIFAPEGGPLSVQLLAPPALPGHYSLTLLDPDRFTIIKDWGNLAFGSAAANTHELPGSAADQNGRILQALTSVGIVDADGSWAVSMTIVQDGLPLVESVADSGTTTELTAEAELNGIFSATAAAQLEDAAP
jgi:hypothetical protein